MDSQEPVQKPMTVQPSLTAKKKRFSDLYVGAYVDPTTNTTVDIVTCCPRIKAEILWILNSLKDKVENESTAVQEIKLS